MKRSHVASALCAVVVLVMSAQPIFAKKDFLEKLKEVYPNLDAKLAKCTTCHTLEGKDNKPKKANLNAYGKELQGASEAKAAMSREKGKNTPEELAGVAAAIKAIGSKDSNGNGKSNDDDIKAGVNPGK